jgi:hypothetical protein
MTLFNYINQNITAVKVAIKSGLINTSVLREWEIYCRYDYYKKNSFKNSDAVEFTGCDFKISDQWVYKIIKKMESENN